MAPLLDGNSAGELIPELVRHGLQQLIELEFAAVLGTERHERSEDRPGYRNGYRPRVPHPGPIQSISSCSAVAGASPSPTGP
jgi:hypothetical protein